MKTVISTMLLSTLLLGCAASVVSSNPRTVLIDNVRKGNAAEAIELAERECRKHDKHAVYVPDNVSDGLATYECVD